MEITRVVINLCKKKWGGGKESESLVCNIFEGGPLPTEILPKCRLGGKSPACNWLHIHLCHHARRCQLLEGKEDEPRRRLRDREKAKYMFFPGYGYGRLVGRSGSRGTHDLVPIRFRRHVGQEPQ